ncbi:peptidase C14 [Ilyonectria robusta]
MDSAGLAQTRPAKRRRGEPSRGVLLSQVYPENDETDTDIDIIAIHGLDTRSPDTWTWVDRSRPEIRVNWLQDPKMLPSKVERARIFTCDWPADLLQPSYLVQETVGELALLLFDGIQRRPLATGDHARREDRPILFIASCLGGIILMKALVDTGETYHSVRSATRGILFLATPFRGTSFQKVAVWVEKALKAGASIQGQQVSNLLDSVKGSTFDLEALVRKFTHLSRHKDPPCLLFNFYELGKTSLRRKVFPLLPNCLADDKLVSTLKNSPFRLLYPRVCIPSSGRLLTFVSWSIGHRRLWT